MPLSLRVLAASSALALLAVGLVAPPSTAAPTGAATPQAACGPGSRPEPGIQGRFAASEFTDGSYTKGHFCNATQVGHVPGTGGFRVERYVDKSGRECAYYDSTLLFPKDVAGQPDGPGTYVLDMSNPAKPVLTATLTTPAMLSPHESLRVNQKRGVLAAGQGSPATEPGIVDLYDLTADCRTPVLKSSTPLGITGHESAMSPDGLTFYVTGTASPTLVGIDISDLSAPNPAWVGFGHRFHGMNISDDGKTMYAADAGTGRRGLTILDVSEVQARALNPTVTEISHLTWPGVSIPQNADPFTIKGHPYLLEMDEFNENTLNGDPRYSAEVRVGAGRIIDIADPAKPFVVSGIRLAVHNEAARAGDSQNDPGATAPAQGYAGHYCSLPTRVDPTVVACSMIVSGLRLFDIRDPAKPVEVGYFNKPGSGGGHAMSSPAYVPERNEVWYSDGGSGFYALRVAGPALLSGTAAAPQAPPVQRPAAPRPAAGGGNPVLAATGLAIAVPLLALALLGLALYLRRRTSAPTEDDEPG
jgi:hypothetical protein